MRRPTMQVFAVTAVAAALMAGRTAAVAAADPVLVFPGMEIRQGGHVCTLGYVDPATRVGFTAGHCQGGGTVTDRDGNVIGDQAVFRSNTPNGANVATDQQIADYEAILLAKGVAVNNILPDGHMLAPNHGLDVHQGDAVCHFGISTGETCGIVERINNGWFTMTDGVASQRGDSGGPVYVVTADGPAVIVGIFNSLWGDFPAAVSWRSTVEQARTDLGMAGNAGGPAV